MSGDYSRQRFDPRKHYSAVLMQQGRVQLDADWNEMAELFDRRFRAERVDTLGRAVVPRETPSAFRVHLQDGALRVGRGRMYVDGLLAENHGAGPLEHDRVLDELRGSQDVAYVAQPYFPTAAASPPPVDAPYLVYLDVWQRERTYLEDPGLVEPALGVDTTTRLQTVWQVRLLPNVAADVTAATPDGDAARLPGWAARVAPSAIRLSTATGAAVAPDVDPCLIPPSGGFRGLENRLYRVEIHDPGAPGQGATFKWSRDNAAVASAVTAVSNDRKELTVVRTGRDALLRFNPGDWVEVTDDRRESDALPGQMVRVEQVDDDARTLRLRAPLAGDFSLDPALHTRVRRWDQAGEVVDGDGQPLVKLGDASAGVVPVPASGAVALESGIKVRFSGGAARVGDHWTFAARSDSASIDILDDAPPRGPGHHYARLAVVDPASGAASDLRAQWPPAGAGAGDCTIFVSAADHNSGRLTVQKALDDLKATGGSICLGPGVFHVTADALRVDSARRIHLRGRGAETVLVRQVLGKFPPPGNPVPAGAVEFDRVVDGADVTGRSLLRVSNTVDFSVEELVLAGSAAQAAQAPLIRVSQCAGVRLERCFVLFTGRGQTHTPALQLAGAVLDLAVRGNVFLSKTAIAADARLLTADLRVEDNQFSCQHRGVELRGLTAHTAHTRIAGNTFAGCADFGVSLGGVVHRPHTVEVAGNTFDTFSVAVLSRATHTTIVDNHMRGPFGRKPAPLLQAEDSDSLPVTQNLAAISLQENEHTPRSDAAVIRGNTIRGWTDGIVVTSANRHCSVRGNTVEGCLASGITVSVPDRCAIYGDVAVADNRVADIFDPGRVHSGALGINVVQASEALVERNSVVRVGRWTSSAPANGFAVAIQVASSMHCAVRDNLVEDLGPYGSVDNAPESIALVANFIYGRSHIVDNRVRYGENQMITTPRMALLSSSGDGPANVWTGDGFVYHVTSSNVRRLAASYRALHLQGNQLEAYYTGRFQRGPQLGGAHSAISIFGAFLDVVMDGNSLVHGVINNPLAVGMPECRVGDISRGQFPPMRTLVRGNRVQVLPFANFGPFRANLLLQNGTLAIVTDNFFTVTNLFFNGAQIAGDSGNARNNIFV